MNGRRDAPIGPLALVCANLIGLLIAAMLFAGLAMGDCLPRDGSAAMRACDAAKRFEFWAFPSLVLAQLLAAFMARKRRAWGLIGPIAAPLLALALVILAEPLFG